MLTRECLQLIYNYGFGATVLTKSDRIMRDIDLLDNINRKTKAVVQMTLTTYDERLCKIIEPNVSSTKERFEVLMACRERGIPTVVWLSPLLPFINDSRENLLGILDYCVKAEVKGIICFGMGLTLREGDREYYYACLDKYFPGLKEKYIKTYGNAYELNSPNNKELMMIFKDVCRKNNIMADPDECFAYLRDFPLCHEQLSLI